MDRCAPVAGDQPSEAARGNSCQPASPSKHRIELIGSDRYHSITNIHYPTNHIIELPKHMMILQRFRLCQERRRDLGTFS